MTELSEIIKYAVWMLRDSNPLSREDRDLAANLIETLDSLGPNHFGGQVPPSPSGNPG